MVQLMTRVFMIPQLQCT